MESYSDFILGNTNLLLHGLSTPKIGKDLYEPMSYFFLDQFCRGMYGASGGDVDRLARVFAGREPDDFEGKVIMKTGENFAKLGIAFYKRFCTPENNLLVMLDGTDIMAKRLGRSDYFPYAMKHLIETAETSASFN